MSNRHFSLLLLIAACGDGAAASPDAAITPPQPDAPPMQQTVCAQLGLTPAALRTDLAWYGNNRADLQAWVDAGGCSSPTFDPAHKPVATFDWDNTISKQDFGDAMTYWFIANAKVKQPPNKDWHNTSAYLSDAAATALSTACGTTVAVGDPLPTDTNTECADEMLSIYDNEVTRGGVAAFNAVNLRRMEAAYAWTPQLMAGYTHAEVQAFAQTGTTAMLNAAIDATQTIGTTVENGWLRINEQQKDLIHVLQSSGFDVWIITASPQDVIGAMSPSLVDVPFDHVVGIRSMTDSAGKLTYAFEGCGSVPDNQMQLIPTIQGKRCFINKVIYGETTNAFTRRPDGQRPYFASADTDSDVEFLRDAKYKLVINRNKSDLMCHAYNNENDSWRVNPMFIEPKPEHAAYPCSTAAFTTETGASEPTRDEGGNIIADQADAVHP
jgi:hypothetical protein